MPGCCRDRRGGRDHIWLTTHDEGSCWVPAAIRPSIILSHWGRMDTNHTTGTGYWEGGAGWGWLGLAGRLSTTVAGGGRANERFPAAHTASPSSSVTHTVTVPPAVPLTVPLPVPLAVLQTTTQWTTPTRSGSPMALCRRLRGTPATTQSKT